MASKSNKSGGASKGKRRAKIVQIISLPLSNRAGERPLPEGVTHASLRDQLDTETVALTDADRQHVYVKRDGTAALYEIREGEGFDWAGSPIGCGNAGINAVIAKAFPAPVTREEIEAADPGRGQIGGHLGYLLHRGLVVREGKTWRLSPKGEKRARAFKAIPPARKPAAKTGEKRTRN